MARVVVLKVALPVESTAIAASCVTPFLKVTVPVGIPAPEAGDTMAAMETLAPEFAAAGVTVREVAVAIGLIFSDCAADVLTS
jgi:hypothetical protein